MVRTPEQGLQLNPPGLDPGSRIIDLTVITTGGTIDGADSDKGTSRPTSDAVTWLSGRSDVNINHIPLFNKDSRQITSSDRQQIIDAVATAPTNCVLVTHGTFTICETGRSLKHSGKIDPGKTVLLVGAWIAFGDAHSDASSQMIFALEALYTPPPGTFIAMDGKLFDPDVTRKSEIGPGVYHLSDDYHAASDSQSNGHGHSSPKHRSNCHAQL